ncbi:MAG: type II secretion system F family protein [Deltaproteobacteria bacterium]|nr:type II secretion system F family protein [Deltaproteobacteria bacterium]
MGQLVQNFLAGPAGYAAVLVVAFGAAMALVMGLRYVAVARRDTTRERLERAIRPSTAVVPADAAEPRPAPETEAKPASIWARLLTPLAKVAQPGDEEERGRLQSRLAYAGIRHERAMAVYLGSKVFFCLALGVFFLWLNSIRPQPLRFAALYTLVLMSIGFYLPNLWLMGRVKDRQSKINRSLPDALDLMVTCVEAGLGLDAAVNRVAEEVKLAAPILSFELSTTGLEMRAGLSRGQAFRRLAQRTGVEELSNLAAIIIQTEIFGTSVARSLRVQSEAMRIRRMQLAEERAATVAVKLTVPLIFCILPSLFAVLMGPAVVRIIRILMPRITGGGG